METKKNAVEILLNEKIKILQEENNNMKTEGIKNKIRNFLENCNLSELEAIEIFLIENE